MSTTPPLVNCSPTKRFFVSMLTRDIDLGDAILDLLDNCVDGAIRSRLKEGGDLTDPNIFDGYWAKINFDEETFSIKDNCGGIPSNATEYAFRMGKPEKKASKDASVEEKLPTVGVYGIGMKRALFKLGRNASVLWRLNDATVRQIKFDQAWFENENEWNLPQTEVENDLLEEPGTLITVQDLHDSISRRFSINSPFRISDFMSQVEWQYSYIINKGFKVICNGQVANPKLLHLLDARDPKEVNGVVRPYLWKDQIEGVNAFVAVGLTGSLQNISDSEGASSRKSYEAGITVICNDRVILYNDKSPLTGWGGGPRKKGVPQYHTQFIKIGGIAYFSCDDPSKLPMTTTKHGVDENSPVYLAAIEKLREGLKVFTGYTNSWKKHIDEEKGFSQKSMQVNILDIMKKYTNLKGEQMPQHLPKPKISEDKNKHIRYRRHEDDIAAVSQFLFNGDANRSPAEVGKASFNYCQTRAIEQEHEEEW